MIFKLALRNILGNGWRSLINMVIIAIVLIGLIWMEAMWYSWLRLAKTQQQQWEFADGMLRVRNYDAFDPFTWESSYAPIPEAATRDISSGRIVPLLYSPGVIYPQGRMMNALVKGIPQEQTLLKFPSAKLKPGGEYLPAVVGKAMATSARLEEGDVFTLRVKDSTGAFNALDLQVAKVMNTPVPSLDIGTVWMDLQALQNLKQLPDMTTVLVLQDASLASVATPEFKNIPPQEFFADLNQIVKTKVSAQSMLFVMLIFLAMLAIFDTQTLAIFKRRKEIGMLSALGMTKGQIIRLFTTEGVLYMLCATVLTLVLGLPVFLWFALAGFSLPGGYESFGIAGFSEPLKFIYPVPLILATLVLMFLITVCVSWLPARKIAAMNTTDALRGRQHV